MSINIYKERMQKAYLFGTPVLCLGRPIPQEDVPQGWHQYDLQGTADDWTTPYRLVDRANKNHAGSILSYLPLKSESAKSWLVKDQYQRTGVSYTLRKFCSDEKIAFPEVPLRHLMRPASPEDAGLFHAYDTPGMYTELGTIGQLRFDYGYSPGQLCRTWWRRTNEDMRSPEFKEELERVVSYFRQGVLKSLDDMKRWCEDHGGTLEGGREQHYGYMVETEHYRYCLHCSPMDKVYQAYLTCFDKQAQKQAFGLTEKGSQTLQEAAPTEGYSMTMGGM